jgi:hypothetical protein
MKVGLNIEHRSGDRSGGELSIAFAASHRSHDHTVDPVHDHLNSTRERVSLFSANIFSKVNFRYVSRPNPRPHPLSPLP